MTQSNRLRTTALTLTLCLASAACASSSQGEPPSTEPPPAQASAPETTDGTVTEPTTTDVATSETVATEPAATEPIATEVQTTDAPPPAPESTEPSSATPRTIEHQYGTTEVLAEPQRIVALSEEFLLADLLALGVTPIASSSNATDGFGGIDPALTEGIEIMTSATFNIEQLAAFKPDLILAYPVYIELVGYDTLNAVAPTVAIGNDNSDWRERLQFTAEVLGVDELGASKIEQFQADHDAARDTLDGVRISAVSIFDQSFLRAYIDRGTFLVDVMVDAGVEMVPSADDIDGADAVGRVQLSLEQLGTLQGDVLLRLQRIGVEDEAAAGVAGSPLWSTLPAVKNGSVVTLDRLGYPGAAGAAAFATDLAAAVEAAQ